VAQANAPRVRYNTLTHMNMGAMLVRGLGKGEQLYRGISKGGGGGKEKLENRVLRTISDSLLNFRVGEVLLHAAAQ